jgi:membrane associated rhomboid family serine protease
MNLAGCLAAFLAAILFYLSASQQRVLARPLGRGARAVATLAAVFASALWVAGQEPMAGIFAALTAVMFAAVFVPYGVWMFRPARARGSQRNES